MTTTLPTEPVISSNEQGWGTRLLAAVCEKCDSAYLLPKENAHELMERCPRCCQPALVALPQDGENPKFAHLPELSAPFELTDAGLEAAIQQFAAHIPYPPQDLNADNLRRRARRLALPVWLVDSAAQALWSAETGFNYQVVSHRDQYTGGGWSSREVKEARVRWEPRVGRLSRSYTNVLAPALEEHRTLHQKLGDYRQAAAKPYHPDSIKNTLLRLPDRTPTDAWSDARAAIQAAAADECRQAASADHIRQFAWQPEFHSQHWTLLLLPVFSTMYLDDEQKPQPVWINAQSGQASGQRRASTRRATRAAGMWLAAAALIFAISLALLAISVIAPPLVVLSVFGFVVAILMGAGATIPLFRVWSFNRRQETA